MTKKNFVQPIFLRKLREHYKSDKELAASIGCSGQTISAALREDSVAAVYENSASLLFNSLYKSSVPPTKGDLIVLMVTLPVDKVDFVSRIVKTLKGEVVEV